MTENQEMNVDNEEIIEYQPRTFKFMTNVLLKASETTTYIEQLERISPDPRVSYRRLLTSMGISAIVFIVVLKNLFSVSDRVKYILLPSILFLLSSLVLLIYYMLPDRDYSSKFEVNLFATLSRLTERLRKKLGFKLSNPSIEFGKKGVFKLADDRYCRLYQVVGQLNNTTLAQYVDQLAAVRDGYLVEREATVDETFITKIKTLSYEDNLRYFREAYQKTNDEWAKDYMSIQYNFIDSQMSYQEIGFIQYLMIADITKDRLDQACQVLHNAAAEGLFEEIDLIEDETEIKTIIGSPLLLELFSERQEEQYGED